MLQAKEKVVMEEIEARQVSCLLKPPLMYRQRWRESANRLSVRPLRYLWICGLLLACHINSAHSAQPPLTSGIDLQAMDDSIRPQDNFHQYVNGAWLKHTAIPPPYANYGTFTHLTEAVENDLRAIIEQGAAMKSPASDSAEQKIGDLYTSFMDAATIEKRGLKPIEKELSLIANIENREDLMVAFAQLLRSGYNVPVAVSVIPDANDAHRYALHLMQSGLGLPDRDYYLDKAQPHFAAMPAAYEKYVAGMLALSGTENASAKAVAVVKLEKAMAQAQRSRADNRQVENIYNQYAVEKLPDLSASMRWRTLLQQLSVANLESVVVEQPDYVKALGELITNVELQTWKDYLRLHVLSGAAPFLPKRFVDQQFDFFSRTLGGVEQQNERWRLAVETVNIALGEPLGQLYVQRYFSAETKAQTLKLVHSLLAEFALAIDDLGWMSAMTKAKARQKLEKIKVKIGYPEKWRDYTALSIDRHDLIGNVRRSRRFDYDFLLAKLSRPVDKALWSMTPQTVNAYYDHSVNEIVIPAAILQPPFFNPVADAAVNYGAAGLMIGHEISHAFDDQGSKFDGDGDLRNWWTDVDRRRFNAATASLVKQYGAYEPLPGMHINGLLTLGENIGDLSGATVAFAAYKRSLKGQSAPVLDGFSGDQRFFLGFARVWQMQYRQQLLAANLVIDPHSPAAYRVNGVVTNRPEFYAAFGVKPGDALYLPENTRVSIW